MNSESHEHSECNKLLNGKPQASKWLLRGQEERPRMILHDGSLQA